MRDGFATDGGGPVVFKAAPLLLRRGRYGCRPLGVAWRQRNPAPSPPSREFKRSTSPRADSAANPAFADTAFADTAFAHSEFLTANFTNRRCLTREHFGVRGRGQSNLNLMVQL